MCIAITSLWAFFVYESARRTVAHEGYELGMAPVEGVLTLTALGLCAYTLSAGPRSYAIDVMTVGAAMIVWCDLRWGIMLDISTGATAFLTIVAAIAFSSSQADVRSTLLGALIVAGIPALIYVASRGRAMGRGDIFLGFSIGAAFGLDLLGPFFAFWCITSFAGYAIVRLMGRRHGEEIVLGPFMGIAVLLTIGFANQASMILGRV